MSDIVGFFTASETQTALSTYKKASLELDFTPSDFHKKIIQHSRYIVDRMLKHPDGWNEHTKSNIEWRGSGLVNSLQTEAIDSEKVIEYIFADLFRFLLEYHYSFNIELSFELNHIIEFVQNNRSNFSESTQEQIDFAFNRMPAGILNRLLSSPSFGHLKKFNDVFDIAQTSKKKMGRRFKWL